MKRRHFLVAAGAAATALPSKAAGEDDNAPLIDHEKVLELTHYTAKCEQATNGKYPDIRLEVRLERKDPEASWSSQLKTFKLNWEGTEIQIAERFWNDLPGLRVRDYPKAEIKKVPEAKRWKLDTELAALHKPRLYLSAESGTVLIEWTRDEECDSSSTIRWIISKSGMVMRHRLEPFHEC